MVTKHFTGRDAFELTGVPIKVVEVGFNEPRVLTGYLIRLLLSRLVVSGDKFFFHIRRYSSPRSLFVFEEEAEVTIALPVPNVQVFHAHRAFEAAKVVRKFDTSYGIAISLVFHVGAHVVVVRASECVTDVPHIYIPHVSFLDGENTHDALGVEENPAVELAGQRGQHVVFQAMVETRNERWQSSVCVFGHEFSPIKSDVGEKEHQQLQNKRYKSDGGAATSPTVLVNETCFVVVPCNRFCVKFMHGGCPLSNRVHSFFVYAGEVRIGLQHSNHSGTQFRRHIYCFTAV